MRILIGVTAGWIAFYAADQAFFGARLVPALPQLAKSILNGFGVYL
jgi:ABC-type antimicrobial peptide transport system permease subunit